MERLGRWRRWARTRNDERDCVTDSARLLDAPAREHARGLVQLGINTLFLLDAGLSNLEAFAATALFTVGMYGAAETLASRVPTSEEYIARVSLVERCRVDVRPGASQRAVM